MKYSVFKKLRRVLTLPSSRTLPQEDLINLLWHLPGVPREVFWLHGMAVSLMELLLTFSHLLLLSASHQEWTQTPGILQLCMAPVLNLKDRLFINWMRNLDIQDGFNWILMGDFNFYRSLFDRNRGGGNF